VKEQRERREAIARMLTRLSHAASFYALQVKHEHLEVIPESLSEMTGLLSDYEKLIS
jgi:hypothetical protein